MRISESQLQLVNKQIAALRAAKNFYGRKLEEAGVSGVSGSSALCPEAAQPVRNSKTASISSFFMFSNPPLSS